MKNNKSYKIEYFTLENQIGKGIEDWILYFDAENHGRPYYFNKKTKQKVMAGSDQQYTFTKKFNKESGIEEATNDITGK